MKLAREKYHNITAEAKESFTKPNMSENASHVNPLQAPSDLVMKMYNNCAITMTRHDVLRVIAAPIRPHPSLNIRNQLKNVCSTKTTTDIHNITSTFLCAVPVGTLLLKSLWRMQTTEVSSTEQISLQK